MNKDKWDKILRKFQFLRLNTDDEGEDELDVEERPVASAREKGAVFSEGDLKEKLKRNRRWVFWSRISAAVFVLLVISGFVIYSRVHTYEDYVISKSYEESVASGTQYVMAGKYIYRYNTDGIACVTRKNEQNWSITYDMQAPIAVVSDTTMAVAEEQGNQVYIVNKDGLVGHFETVLPILKVKVADNGVVAVILQENEVTWVKLYQPDGTVIANDKTTIPDSGYPLDVALSPDGQRMAVSYVRVTDGIVTSDVVFYHFGKAGENKENHIVSSTSYQETVIPEIYFTDNSRAVAVTDGGFIVFKGKDAPEESEKVAFSEEIISTFHDDDYIGFLFHSQEDGCNYRMELYNYHGRRKTSRDIYAEYETVKMENGQIVMYSDRKCMVFTKAGMKKFTSAYEKDIINVFNFSEFRKYLVITRDSFDQIRIS